MTKQEFPSSKTYTRALVGPAWCGLGPPYQPQYAAFQALNTMSPAPNRESEQARAMQYQALRLTLAYCCLPSDFKGFWRLSGERARALRQLKQHNPEYLSANLSV